MASAIAYWRGEAGARGMRRIGAVTSCPSNVAGRSAVGDRRRQAVSVSAIAEVLTVRRQPRSHAYSASKRRAPNHRPVVAATSACSRRRTHACSSVRSLFGRGARGARGIDIVFANAGIAERRVRGTRVLFARRRRRLAVRPRRQPRTRSSTPTARGGGRGQTERSGWIPSSPHRHLLDSVPTRWSVTDAASKAGCHRTLRQAGGARRPRTQHGVTDRAGDRSRRVFGCGAHPESEKALGGRARSGAWARPRS